ncbi:MAG: hypothetical protein AABY22_21980 [Nanoarchaeota archaeon]
MEKQTNLKTLKDLQSRRQQTFKDHEDPEGKTFKEYTIWESELKQEAIKWIKDLEEAQKADGSTTSEYCFNCKKIITWDKDRPKNCVPEKHFLLDWDWEERSDMEGAKKFIKYFFDLTEE